MSSTRLACAKQAWLALKPNERAAFQEFVLAQAETSGTLAILLSDGTGKRARYNGQHAMLVAGSKRSGWVDVNTESGETIVWRSGAWTVVPETVCIPADAIGLILSHCDLRQRLLAMSTSKQWATQASDPIAWRSLCTPLDATAYTAKRLISLLMRAGDGLQLLDIGCDSGRCVGVDLIDVDDDDAGIPAFQNPLAATLASLATSHKLAQMHTLRLRYHSQWADGQLLAQVVRGCPVLETLYAMVENSRTTPDTICALAAPTLRSLHLNFDGSLSDDDNDDDDMEEEDGDDGARRRPDRPIFTERNLPLANCSALHTLSLSGFVKGYHYEGPVFSDAAMPSTVRCLRLSIPDGGLINFQPQLPLLETLHVRVLKTGGPLLRPTGVPQLQHLHLEGFLYGPPRLVALYQDLLDCVHLRYLRVAYEGWSSVYEHRWGEPGGLSGLKHHLSAIIDLDDMWFCEVPHDADRPSGWARVPQPSRTQRPKRDEQRKAYWLVRRSAKYFDPTHYERLQADPSAALPALSAIDGHPETADQRTSEHVWTP